MTQERKIICPEKVMNKFSVHSEYCISIVSEHQNLFSSSLHMIVFILYYMLKVSLIKCIT